MGGCARPLAVPGGVHERCQVLSEPAAAGSLPKVRSVLCTDTALGLALQVAPPYRLTLSGIRACQSRRCSVAAWGPPPGGESTPTDPPPTPSQSRMTQLRQLSHLATQARLCACSGHPLGTKADEIELPVVTAWSAHHRGGCGPSALPGGVLPPSLPVSNRELQRIIRWMLTELAPQVASTAQPRPRQWQRTDGPTVRANASPLRRRRTCMYPFDTTLVSDAPCAQVPLARRNRPIRPDRQVRLHRSRWDRGRLRCRHRPLAPGQQQRACGRRVGFYRQAGRAAGRAREVAVQTVNGRLCPAAISERRVRTAVSRPATLPSSHPAPR